jgi:acetoin utilization protein AcuC
MIVVMGERIARYGFPDGHPFGPDRHAAFAREFEERGLRSRAAVVGPRLADLDELRLFHTDTYVAYVIERSHSGGGFLDGGDTPAFRGVFEAAAAVVGATLVATEAIARGEARAAFVPIAGLHHAARDRAAGFCVFNDIGVAIEYLRHAHGIRRIAYVDIDAHHGDGVYYAYEDDAELVFADIHQDGRTLYPGTGRADERGRGAGTGLKLNLPFPPGADDVAFDAAWPKVLALLEAQRPEFIIFQCGADSIAGDPIAQLALSRRSHDRAARDLRALADSFGHGRVLALGGGGYDRTNLAQAWNDVVAALA